VSPEESGVLFFKNAIYYLFQDNHEVDAVASYRDKKIEINSFRRRY